MNVRLGWPVKVLGIVVLGLGLGSAAMAQPGGGGPGGGGPGGRGGDFMNNPMMLLRSEQVQKALEIVDDQVEQIDEIGNEMRDAMRDAFQNFRDMSDEERQKKMTELNEDFQAKVDEILLPHQQKRLKQIALQQRTRGMNGIAGALDGDLAKELKITSAQKEEMQKVAEEARKEMEEKIVQLRKDMEDKVLSVLDSDQREKFQELVGEPFELDFRQMFRGGQQGGGRRGQGGEGGRGGRGQGRGNNDF